ncbi:hypothetical protein DFH94DRAFT_639787, partial [Russula ochroleuca]
LEWATSDVEGPVNFLVEEKGFYEERLCKCVDLEKLVKSLDAKQQIQLDGFFATTPNTSSPKVPTNLKDPKGKESQ